MNRQQAEYIVDHIGYEDRVAILYKDGENEINLDNYYVPEEERENVEYIIGLNMGDWLDTLGAWDLLDENQDFIETDDERMENLIQDIIEMYNQTDAQFLPWDIEKEYLEDLQEYEDLDMNW